MREVTMRQTLKKALGRAGFVPAPRPIAPELAPIIDRVAPYTMCSPERVAAVIDAIDYLVSNRIGGDVVECGVWRGGTMMAAALRLMEHGEARGLWLYDTFEGMPEPDPQIDGKDAHRRWKESRPAGAGSDWCLAGIDDVAANMAATGYPSERMRFVAGKVEDTIPETMPDRIGLLRLDTDWYASTRHELEHLAPRVVSGGVVLVDDYGHWAGAREAVDEWTGGCGFPVLWHRTDYTGRAAVLCR
jgi:O-methyltransferase